MLATGKSVEEVALENGCSRFSFYRTIKGTTKGQKPMGLISQIIGKPIDEIWPEPATGRK